MPRKLNWNKSLDNPDANAVHEVVRSYISPQTNKEELQINQDITDLSNVVNNVISNVVSNDSSNVASKALKDVEHNTSSLSNTNVLTSVVTDPSTVTPDNAQTDERQRAMLDILLSLSKSLVKKPPTDANNNAPIDTINNTFNKDNSIKITGDNTQAIPQKSSSSTTKTKRESFKRDPLSNSVAAMAEWHTRAEQKVYEVMYKETIMHRQRTRFFSYKELSTKTGLRNNRTIINAVNGLEEKKSIDVLTSRRGEKLGREYLIYPPHEILSRRREIGMKVHSQTKKVIETQNKP